MTRISLLTFILCISIFGCSRTHDFNLKDADGCYSSSKSASFSIERGWFVFRTHGVVKRSRLEKSQDNLGDYIVTDEPIVIAKGENENEFQLWRYRMKIRPVGNALMFTFPTSGETVKYRRNLGPCKI